MRAALVGALAIAVGGAACSTSPELDPPPSDTAPVAPATAGQAAPEPVARIASADGRARLDVAYACVAEASATGPRRVVMQAAARADVDVLVADGAAAQSRVLRGGIPVEGARVSPHAWGTQQNLSVEFPVAEGAVSLADMAVECPLLLVTGWTEHVVTVTGTAPEDAREIAASPWRLRCGYNAELHAVSVTVWNAGERTSLTGLLTHVWAIEAITVSDNSPDGFDIGSGGGTGGASVMSFGRMNGTRPVPPFTVRLRVPSTWTLETVTFPLDGLTPVPLPR